MKFKKLISSTFNLLPSTFIFSLFIFLLNQNLSGKEISWYIGAAFIKPADEIAKQFEEKYKNVKVVIISGGSQIIFQKIILSKKGDIFMPGAEYYGELAKKKGVVLYLKDFVIQSPVFGISSEARLKINNFKDLCKKNVKIALGNEKTMALGRIFVKILEKFPGKIRKCIIDNCVIKGTNVLQIANYVKMNIVDAGILFESVAKIFKFKIVKIPAKYNVIDKAPLIILKYSKDLKLAKKFFRFVIENKNIFKKYGFKTCL